MWSPKTIRAPLQMCAKEIPFVFDSHRDLLRRNVSISFIHCHSYGYIVTFIDMFSRYVSTERESISISYDFSCILGAFDLVNGYDYS